MATGSTATGSTATGSPHCESLSREAVTRFARRLAGRAATGLLTPADIDRELAAWLEPSPVLMRVCRQAFEDCERARTIEDTPCRRWHVLERALVHRFEHMLRCDDDSVPLVSRRMLLGLTFAVTKLIGAERFSSNARQANTIVADHASPDHSDLPSEALADPRLRALVNRTLMDLARRFDDFPRQLAEFLRLINSRLSAPQTAAWDEEWSVTRRTLLLVLEALYADLRDEMERYEAPELLGRYGADGPEILKEFLTALDQAMRLADRPWLLKTIR